MEKRNQGRCPKCGRELLEFSYQEIRIDQCANCDGIWLDEGELEQIKRARRDFLFSNALNVKWAHAKQREAKLTPEELEELKALAHMRCPRCSSALAEIEDHGIPVDRCTLCGGIWLDPGEFGAVAGAEHGILARLNKFLYG
jgi:Zn-finger nucleic acid-binding protein